MASKLQTKTLRLIKDLGRDKALAYSINAMAFSLKGLPDIVVHIKGGRSMFAEIKEVGDRLSGVQKERIRQLRELGFHVSIIKNIDDVKDFVYNVSKGVEYGQKSKDDDRVS